MQDKGVRIPSQTFREPREENAIATPPCLGSRRSLAWPMQARLHEGPRSWLFQCMATDRLLAHHRVKDMIGRHEGFARDTKQFGEFRLKQQLPMAYPTRGSSEVCCLVHLRRPGQRLNPVPEQKAQLDKQLQAPQPMAVRHKEVACRNYWNA